MGIDTDKDQEITSAHTRHEAAFLSGHTSLTCQWQSQSAIIINYKIPHVPYWQKAKGKQSKGKHSSGSKGAEGTHVPALRVLKVPALRELKVHVHDVDDKIIWRNCNSPVVEQ